MNLCKHCGRPEDEHHTFEAVAIPEGCQCDPETWRKGEDISITPICASYKNDGGGYCVTCEHDEACHGKQGPVKEER